LVVLAQRGPRRWIVGSRHPAIAEGLDWGTAQSMLPTLRPQPRDLHAEKETLEALCTWAWQFGSEVVRDTLESPLDYGRPGHRIAIGITPSLRLFGGLDALLGAFDSAFASLGHMGQRGVAPTLDAAILLARAGLAKPVEASSQLRTALAPLPLPLLDLPPPLQNALRAIGLRTLADLLALPMDGLARRYGPALVAMLDRLLGHRADGRPRHRLATRFSRRFDLAGEVEAVEELDLPLRRMTQELGTYLLARDSGVQEFRMTLEHARRRVSSFDLRLAAASRAPDRLYRVIRERLDRATLPEPVRALRLSASRFAAPAAGQQDLFDPRSDEEWLSLLEALSARLGHDAVHALATAQDCRPERAWRRIAPEISAAAAPSKQTGVISSDVASNSMSSRVSPMAIRPLWLVEPPRQLAIPPAQLSAPERIEGGWWDAADVSRDYYHAHLGRSRVWVFQDRRTQAWYLHGFWA
jgi:protein ImuB